MLDNYDNWMEEEKLNDYLSMSEPDEEDINYEEHMDEDNMVSLDELLADATYFDPDETDLI